MKTYNDGNDLEAPRFIPVGVEPVEFIPYGQEDRYVTDSLGRIWDKQVWERMRM